MSNFKEQVKYEDNYSTITMRLLVKTAEKQDFLIACLLCKFAGNRRHVKNDDEKNVTNIIMTPKRRSMGDFLPDLLAARAQCRYLKSGLNGEQSAA